LVVLLTLTVAAEAAVHPLAYKAALVTKAAVGKKALLLKKLMMVKLIRKKLLVKYLLAKKKKGPILGAPYVLG
jgi:hypothetical protein